MINRGASGLEAALPFSLVSSIDGTPKLAHAWNNVGGGVTDELMIRLPGAVGFDEAVITQIFELGGGDYEYRMTAFETVLAGKVYYHTNVTNYDIQRRWEDILGASTAFTDLSTNVAVIAGLLHLNGKVDNTTYNANNLMTAARLRVFATAAACNAASDGAADNADAEVYRFAITGVDEGDGNLLSYKLTRTL